MTKKKSRKPDKISVSAILNLYFLVRKCLSPELKLDGETTTRTKNNLIFKNNVMEITKEDVMERLVQLEEVLHDDIPHSIIKERLLDLIISDKDQVKAIN